MSDREQTLRFLPEEFQPTESSVGSSSPYMSVDFSSICYCFIMLFILVLLLTSLF